MTAEITKSVLVPNTLPSPPCLSSIIALLVDPLGVKEHLRGHIQPPGTSCEDGLLDAKC